MPMLVCYIEIDIELIIFGACEISLVNIDTSNLLSLWHSWYFLVNTILLVPNIHMTFQNVFVIEKVT
jgi:hypothetical protein